LVPHSYAAAPQPPGAPRVLKIEPPNWWVGLKPDPMLLLAGENLQNAKVGTSYAGIRVRKQQAQPDGHYVFVWLAVAAPARPGVVSLTLKTLRGTVNIPLPLLKRETLAGRFQGISPDDVIYLIMPDRFADGDLANDRPSQSAAASDRSLPRAYHGGDLRGIRDHLAYLHGLGVTTLWLTPIWKNTDSDYHGYYVVDFYAVDDHLGSLQEYQELVAAAHRLGMKILFDFVANHVGPRHPWATSPPSATWLHGSPGKHVDAPANFARLTDPHATPREYRDVIEGWFGNTLPDLNNDDPRVARYLLQTALWWTESTGVDGFRLDTFPYSSRRFWSGWHEGIFRTYPRMTTIGEVWDRDVSTTSFFEGGRFRFDGLDSRVTTLFDFPLYYALRDVILRGQSVQRMIEVLQRDWLYSNPNHLVTFVGNHDTRRFMGEPGASAEKLKAAFALLLTLRGIPGIYYGDEIGMPGGDDPDNRRDFPGGFPGDARSAFTADGRAVAEQELFSHVQSLLRLRRNHSALRQGAQWHIGWDDTYYAFLRATPEEQLLVVFNNSPALRTLTLPLGDTPLADARRVTPLLTAPPAELHDGRLSLQLAPEAVAIYEVDLQSRARENHEHRPRNP